MKIAPLIIDCLIEIFDSTASHTHYDIIWWHYLVGFGTLVLLGIMWFAYCMLLRRKHLVDEIAELIGCVCAIASLGALLGLISLVEFVVISIKG